MTIAPLVRRATLGVALACAAALGACRPAHARYVPRDSALAAQPLFFYPPAGAAPARAVVMLFGNDIGFWEAHQELAERLAGAGYAVVGFDVKRFLATLPDDAPGERVAAYRARIGPLLAHARHELGADTLPLVLGGHSLGAEIALWTAAHAPPPRLAGVLALSPGARGHLRVTLADVATDGEPHEADSFPVAAVIAALPPGVRVALVRGRHDVYARADSALRAAGGARLREYGIPFAGHSLHRMTIAGWVVERALRDLLAPAP